MIFKVSFSFSNFLLGSNRNWRRNSLYFIFVDRFLRVTAFEPTALLVERVQNISIYCNGMALPPERFWWKTARWPASAIRSRQAKYQCRDHKRLSQTNAWDPFQNHKTKLTSISQNALTHIFLYDSWSLESYSYFTLSIAQAYVCPSSPWDSPTHVVLVNLLCISFLYPCQPKYLPVQ